MDLKYSLLLLARNYVGVPLLPGWLPPLPPSLPSLSHSLSISWILFAVSATLLQPPSSTGFEIFIHQIYARIKIQSSEVCKILEKISLEQF